MLLTKNYFELHKKLRAKAQPGNFMMALDTVKRIMTNETKDQNILLPKDLLAIYEGLYKLAINEVNSAELLEVIHKNSNFSYRMQMLHALLMNPNIYSGCKSWNGQAAVKENIAEVMLSLSLNEQQKILEYYENSPVNDGDKSAVAKFLAENTFSTVQKVFSLSLYEVIKYIKVCNRLTSSKEQKEVTLATMLKKLTEDGEVLMHSQAYGRTLSIFESIDSDDDRDLDTILEAQTPRSLGLNLATSAVSIEDKDEPGILGFGTQQ